MVSISHFKMLWTVSGTYYGEVALSSPILFVVFLYWYILLILFLVDFINIYFFDLTVFDLVICVTIRIQFWP